VTKVQLCRSLDETPQNEEIWKSGVYCPDIIQPLFKSYDKGVEIQTDNKMFHKRLAAANKIASLDLEGCKEMMIRLNGSFFKTPETVEECQNGLVDFLDEANEAALDDIIRSEITDYEEVALIVGKAVAQDIISFDMVQDTVVKNTPDGRMIPLKEVPSSYAASREREYSWNSLPQKTGHLF
jgi:hypothetical protein